MLVFSCRGSFWLLTLLAIAILLGKRTSAAGLVPLLDSGPPGILLPSETCLMSQCGPELGLFTIICNSICQQFGGTSGICTPGTIDIGHKFESGKHGGETHVDRLNSGECICGGEVNFAQEAVQLVCTAFEQLICTSCGFGLTFSCVPADGNRNGANLTCT